MATTKAPLFGLDASGSLAGAITFSKWRGRTYVRKLAIPANPRTGLQTGMRSSMRFITQTWASLTEPQKLAWADLAAADNITYLNAQVRDAQTRTRLNEGVRRGPDEVAGTTPDAAVLAAVTELPKTLRLTWAAGADAPQYDWMVHMATTTGFTPDVSNLIAILPAATLSLTVPKLETGTEYFFVVVGGNFDGTLGPASNEESGTPT